MAKHSHATEHFSIVSTTCVDKPTQPTNLNCSFEFHKKYNIIYLTLKIKTSIFFPIGRDTKYNRTLKPNTGYNREKLF